MNKLREIQNALRVGKAQWNDFGKYNYRSCEDILEAVKPLLTEHNCDLRLTDEIVNVGTRNYVKAIATFIDEDKEIIATSFAREDETKKGMDGSQITGAASSYARKYALNALFLIDDTKDSDATNEHGKATPQPTAPKTTAQPQKTATAAVGKCQDCGADMVVNPKTSKKFCSAKCWLQPKPAPVSQEAPPPTDKDNLPF